MYDYTCISIITVINAAMAILHIILSDGNDYLSSFRTHATQPKKNSKTQPKVTFYQILSLITFYLRLLWRSICNLYSFSLQLLIYFLDFMTFLNY